MDLKQRRISEASTKSSFSVSDPSRNLNPDRPFTQFDPTNLCYGARTEQPFPGFSPPFDTPSLHSYHPEHEAKKVNQSEPTPICNNTVLDWDPRAMLSNLSFLEQKIHQVQDIVRSIISRQGQCSNRSNELAAQQQLVTADLTCIIIQLISTAGTLLPSVKNTILSTSPSARQLESIIGSPTSFGLNGTLQQDEGLSSEGAKPSEYDELIKGLNDCGGEGNESIPIEEHDVKDSEDGVDGENLPPGSYEVLQLEKEEILAPHTHFCLICGKGFKRDANLRMHMRGHGDEYKTPAALAKPSKDLNSEPVLIKRYSCPFVGCKRNKDHKKFQPLKTILCVKNHYKRTHCDKSYTCSRCNSKKFSVIADLKTHEKHCGRHKWLCSCGTTFSRKDKLFGHVALFQGHTPALPMDEVKSSGASSDQGQNNGAMAGTGIMGYNFPGSTAADDIMDTKGVNDDRGGYFSPMNFDSCNFGGLDDFPQPAFEVSENSFSFIHSGSCTFARRNGENSSSNRFR